MLKGLGQIGEAPGPRRAVPAPDQYALMQAADGYYGDAAHCPVHPQDALLFLSRAKLGVAPTWGDLEATWAIEGTLARVTAIREAHCTGDPIEPQGVPEGRTPYTTPQHGGRLDTPAFDEEAPRAKYAPAVYAQAAVAALFGLLLAGGS